MLEAKFDFDHDKRDTRTNELGWKLFVLRLADILATLAVKLAWLAALIWAFATMLEHIH